LYFDDLGPDPYIKEFLNVTFEDIGYERCVIRWHKITNITDHLKKEEQDELLFSKDDFEPLLYSRISFRINGPLENTTF
jgi:hypothetical protein